jgi:DNA-binding MarR family transcriptional regulator
MHGVRTEDVTVEHRDEALGPQGQCIGIDDALAGQYLGLMTRDASVKSDSDGSSARFAQLYPEIYLRLHLRKDRSSTRVTPQMWAVLQHLAMAGPLTVTEASAHFDRAQSVVSETIDALCAKNLLERMRDERDRRRTLVWLTDHGQAFLTNERRVLDEVRLAQAMQRLSPAQRRGLIAGVTALVEACDALRIDATKSNRKRSIGDGTRKAR